MTGRKERNKKIQLRLWDSTPQPLAYMDKGPTMLEPCLLQSVQGIGGGVGISVCSSDKYRPTEITSGRVTTENSLSKFLMGNQFNEVSTDLHCTRDSNTSWNSCLVHSM